MKVKVLILALLVVLLAGCGGVSIVPEPVIGFTPSPVPSVTPMPSVTPTATQTPAPEVAEPSPQVPPGEEMHQHDESPAGQQYVVQPGDTLHKIAQRFGTTVDAIARANNINDVNVISVGQTLVIPQGGQ